MRKRTSGIVLAVLFLLTASYCSKLYAETYPYAPVQASDPKVYRVLMKTRFVVPSSGVPVDQLRVWHALPTKREWSGTDTQVGGTNISWIPATGQKQYERSHGSHHVYWDTTVLHPGRTLYFESQFTVRSQVRVFDPTTSQTTWADYVPASLPDADARRDIHADLANIADRIKASTTPSAAVLEFCKWLSANITYDASVSYPYNDVASVMRNRRGHCAHYAEMLIQLCNRAGIPGRRVFGMNLYAPDGVTGGLQNYRADYTNTHTWVEVYFPRIGWVEVEPSSGEQGFTIPARYIQNNTWFQNYAIWISQKGTWKQPEWLYQNGASVSAYGIENIISYSEQ